MLLAAIAAPACGGRVAFSVDAQGQLHAGACAERITVYLGRLAADPAAAPADALAPAAAPASLRHRQRALIAQWLSEHDALAHGRTQSAAVELATTDLGKPYWPTSQWQLNWSHSQGYVALAIAPQTVFSHANAGAGAGAGATSCTTDPRPAAGHLGIDIEQLGRARAKAALVNRYFHPSEHAIAHDEPGFLTVWTRKEAVLKAHGMGLRTDLKSLNTASDPIAHEQLGHWHCVSVHTQGSLDAGHEEASAILSLSWPYHAPR